MQRTPFSGSVQGSGLPARLTAGRRSLAHGGLAVVSLLVFMLGGLALGLPGLGLAVGLWLAAVGGRHVLAGRWRLHRAERDRAACAERWERTRRAREEYAARHDGMTYQRESVREARGFGRIDQDVPEDLAERERRLAREGGAGRRQWRREAAELDWSAALARHAAGLTALSVLRTRVRGFPVTVFDLPLVDEDDAWELCRFTGAARAAEAARDYLTVWCVALPLALPYVSSAAAWEDEPPDEGDGPAGEAHGGGGALTDDWEAARLLLSVPEVRASALDPRATPWWVEGERLLACVRSNDGVAPERVAEVAAELAGLAGRFPWAGLERYRIPFPDPHGAACVRLTHRWYGRQDGPGVIRWEAQRLTRTGLRAFVRTGQLVRLGPEFLWLTEPVPGTPHDDAPEDPAPVRR
ncbi:hypothetical protein [Streptomyces sp. YIM 98790]|uniref:hypothetical protein n=1 Tax=Streptomyces sp. YIM 98790 TaxID=2689077 RepID=UPI00140B773B|nr:hypothetical protein [Streptomyces sp. YIM 98790]